MVQIFPLLHFKHLNNSVRYLLEDIFHYLLFNDVTDAPGGAKICKGDT